VLKQLSNVRVQIAQISVFLTDANALFMMTLVPR
jgi:hypothetical protein